MIRPAAHRGSRPPRPGHDAVPDAVPAVHVTDEQTGQVVDVARWETLALEVLGAEGVPGGAELSLLFVDEAQMTDLNASFMGQDGPTDVLAFPIDAGQPPGEHPSHGVPVLLGDVVICPAVAARNAPAHAGTVDDEIALLVVHGILHVLGLDHADPVETEVMQARERALLERFHRDVR